MQTHAPSTTAPPATLLRVAGVTKAFGPTVALRGCSLELRAGEVHALMGENGSGKSTLVKILAGVHRADGGQVVIGDSPLRAASPRAAAAAGVATVFQEVQCVPAQSVLDNLWLGADGLLRRGAAGPVSAGPAAGGGRRERAAAVLAGLLGACPDGLLSAPAGTLSLSERQAVAIGRALLRAPRVLILDEATSALDVATRDRLFAAVRRLTAAGGAVLFISHRMDEVTEIADRVTVLRAGESVATLDRDDAAPGRLVTLMTGGEHLVQAAARAGGGPAEPVSPSAAEPAAGAAAVPAGEVVLAAAGLTLRAGEIVGLAGLEGQGQDEYLRALRSGRGPDGTQARAAYVARDRREESIFPPLSVRENFTAATLTRDARAGLISARRASARFAGYAERLKIRLGRDHDAITTLSGGNQQKVVIARALARDPRALLLNDPTRGVDIGAKRDIYALLRELAASGLAIVMLSTEVDEHLELMDRVLVFRDGAPAAELPGGGLTRTDIVAEFFGGSAGGPGGLQADDSPGGAFPLGRPAPRGRPRSPADGPGSLTSGSAPAPSAAAASPASASPASASPASASPASASPAPASPETGASAGAAAARPARAAGRGARRDRSWELPAALAVALLIANFIAQHSLLSWSAWPVIFAELATPALLAMASTPAILGGGIDISVAPLFTLVSVLIAVVLLGHGVTSAFVVIPVAVAAGALVGAVNGVLVNYGRFQAVVATLCVNFILSGFALGYAPSPVPGTTGWLTALGSTWGGVPGGLVLIAVPLLAWWGLGRTPFVKTLLAVGGSEATAYTAGVNVAAVRTAGYAAGGAIAGLAGVAITAQLHQAEADAGFVTPFILLALAAVALGGNSMTGGRGSLLGALLGAAVIFLIENLLGALGLSSFWSRAVYGATLIAAVVFAAVSVTRTRRRTTRRRTRGASPTRTRRTTRNASLTRTHRTTRNASPTRTRRTTRGASLTRTRRTTRNASYGASPGRTRRTSPIGTRRTTGEASPTRDPLTAGDPLSARDTATRQDDGPARDTPAARDNSNKRSRHDYAGYFDPPEGVKVSRIFARPAAPLDNSNKRASATAAPAVVAVVAGSVVAGSVVAGSVVAGAAAAGAAAAGAAGVGRARGAGRRLAGVQRRLPVLQVLVLVALVLYVGAKDGDYTWGDLWAPILLQASFLGIAAAGQTLAILVGGLDFSIAAYIVAGNLLTTHLVGLEHWNFAACALLILAICLAGGGLSGWACHRFGLEPLVVTLGMSSVVVGALLGTDSKLVNGAGPGWLQSFTAQGARTFGLPLPPIIAAWIVLAAVVSVILARTPLGRRLYLAGSGPRAAEIAGISTRRVWTGVYAASAVLAGLAGVLLAGFSTGGDTNVGNNYLFPGLAAVIVGGTMMGGRGDYLRTCLGALIITALNFVISVQNVNAAAAQVVFGALILATVALYGRERRLRDRV